MIRDGKKSGMFFQGFQPVMLYYIYSLVLSSKGLTTIFFDGNLFLEIVPGLEEDDTDLLLFIMQTF